MKVVMKVKDLLVTDTFTLLNENSNITNQIHKIFASDLLSHVMGYAEENDILITVLNNINVLGVASLLDLSCVIFSHGTTVNQTVVDKATELEIPLLLTNLTTTATVIELYKMGVGS